MNMQSLGPVISTENEPRKAGRERMRALNLQIVLQLVHSEHTTTRAEVARTTGLTRATVSSLVADLIDAKLVVEAGVAPSAGGKPPTKIRIDQGGRQLALLDLSARPFRGLLVDLLLQPIGDVALARSSDDHDTAIENLVERLTSSATSSLLGVAVATPGVVDADGVVVEATNLGWVDHPLGPRLAERFEVPVLVSNDAHASAIAAHAELVRQRRSTGVATGDLLLVRIAEGLGAGIVLGGGLHLGSHRAAGEIGHVVVDVDGEDCRCGNAGCLETIASRAAIVRAIAGTDAISPDVTLDMLGETYGASRVAEALKRAGVAIGGAASVLVNALDVSEIVVHSASDGAEAIAEGLRGELGRRVLPALRPDLEVRTMSDPNLPLMGAAVLLRQDQLGFVIA